MLIPTFADWDRCEIVRHTSVYPNHSIGLHLYAAAYAAAKRVDEPQIVEIGFWKGYTAAMMLCGMFDAGSGGRLLSVDNGTCEEGLVNIRGLPNELHKLFDFHQGNSDSPETIQRVQQNAKCFGGLDLLFLDGGDTAMRNKDVLTYAPMMKQGGVIICHDSNMFDCETVDLGAYRGLAVIPQPVKWKSKMF